MTVGGEGRGFSDAAEITSLDPFRHPVPDCYKSVARFPHRVVNAAGGWSPRGSYPLVCGGFALNTGAPTANCFTYNPSQNSWYCNFCLVVLELEKVIADNSVLLHCHPHGGNFFGLFVVILHIAELCMYLGPKAVACPPSGSPPASPSTRTSAS